jgi:hypothetical protein
MPRDAKGVERSIRVRNKHTWWDVPQAALDPLWIRKGRHFGMLEEVLAPGKARIGPRFF